MSSISFLCDFDGRMIRILRDDIGLSARLKPGVPFTLVCETDGMSKAFAFLNEIKQRGVAFDWELCVLIGNRIEVLYFAGYTVLNDIFIVASQTRSIMLEFVEEFMQIANEQSTDVRAMMKKQIQMSLKHSEQEKRHYEELTRLNNELEIAHRQLEKKNLELENANRILEQKKQELESVNRELTATVEELSQTRHQLIQSEKMASLGRLVSGFAHEINTPIGIALTASSSLYEAKKDIHRMLAQEEVSEEELISALETIQEASELICSNLRRAADLVGSFKRTSVDQISETQRLFEIDEVIQDAILSLSSRFRKTSIEIRADCPKGINLYGYPGCIGQVLTNLMMNSLIHGFEDGNLSGQIHIQARVDQDTVVLDYSDSGKGMEESVVQKIFEPFFTTRRARGGTGLGMYICYNIITAQLNGSIECSSAPGHGVRFHMTFPVQRPS